MAEQKETARYKELLKEMEGRKDHWFSKHNELDMKLTKNKEIWLQATAKYKKETEVYGERFRAQEKALATEKKENQPLRDRVAQLEAELKEAREQQLELTKALGAKEERLRQETESTTKWRKERNNAVKKANETVSKFKQMKEGYRL